MNKIVSKEQFSEKVFKLVVEAPLIARSRKAGHFVIIRVGERGERVPLTIADADPVKGTITLVVQTVGHSTTQLCALEPGDYITDVVGPLGQATHIENFGTVVCAGGGVGVAPMLPIIKALKEAGNRVISVLAGRTKELIILEEEVRKHSDEVIIMTDDGSYGEKGFTTDKLKELIEDKEIVKSKDFQPTIVLLSDGCPTDYEGKEYDSLENYLNWSPIKQFHEAPRCAKCMRVAMSVDEATDLNMLRAFLNNETEPMQATNANDIAKMFKWVTMSTISRMSSTDPDNVQSFLKFDSDSEDDDILV